MTAPVVWIALPLVVGALLLLLPWERVVAYLGTIFALILAAVALWLPPDTAQRIVNLSVRIDSTLILFGRQVSLTQSDQTVLILVYGMAAFWFFGSLAAGNARRIVPLGLGVVAFLVASLAVEPFLYAALFIEIAVLLSVTLLTETGQRPGRGLIRFLIYQTLAMPFILFAGFLLSGVEAGPGDVALITQAAFLLALGFGFLLWVFPLYTWIPVLAEEAQPYAVGFILTVFPTFALVFGLHFIDRYSWLRDSSGFSAILQVVGLVTAVTAGVWAAFQRHLARIVAYAVLVETGFSILAVSLPDRSIGLQILFAVIAPRALALAVWMMSITILKDHLGDLKFSTLQGKARLLPVATAGVVLSNLALAGVPLMAIFPVRQVLWENIATQSMTVALGMGVVQLGLWVGALRSLAVLTMAPEKTFWKSQETWSQRILILLGLFSLFLFGVFPQWAQVLLRNMPAMFEHLGK